MGCCSWEAVGEAGGESAGKPDRIKTEGPGLNQHAHSKGLLFCGWLCHPDIEEKIVERWREGGGRKEALEEALPETVLVLVKPLPPFSPCKPAEGIMVPGRQ